MGEQSNKNWRYTIEPSNSVLKLGLKEVWEQRDLLFLLVKRDFVSFYKQTVLGPLWFFIQPLLLTLTYVFIFGNVAKLSADGLPHLLFYLSGIVSWTYFSDAVNQTSTTFLKNASVFGKVYFPRVIVPVSVVLTNLLKLGIQLALFFVIMIWYIYQGYQIAPTFHIVFLPFLIVLMAFLGLGCGLLVSALTTKYRDLQFLVVFGVQLLMYASTVIFPLSSLTGTYELVIMLNPMSAIIESIRFMLLGSGSIPYGYLAYSIGFGISIFVLGLVLFNRTEKNFMDTV